MPTANRARLTGVVARVHLVSQLTVPLATIDEFASDVMPLLA